MTKFFVMPLEVGDYVRMRKFHFLHGTVQVAWNDADHETDVRLCSVEKITPPPRRARRA